MPARAKTSAIKYNRPITIIQPRIDDDAQGEGGARQTWLIYYKCFASIESFARGRGILRPYFDGQLYPEQLRIIAIRWQSSFPVDATMRVQHTQGNKLHEYQIIGVDNLQEANVEIILLCQELQAKGSP